MSLINNTGLSNYTNPALVFPGEGLLPKSGFAVCRIHPSLGASGTGTITAALGTYKTCDQQLPAPGTFKGVRLIYANFDTSGSMPIAKAKVASAPKHLASTGVQLTWYPVTFDGLLTANIPAAKTGTAQQSPGLLLSDIIPLNSIARTDGGSRPLIRVRSLIDGVASARTVTGLTLGSQLTAFNSADFNNGYQLGVYTSTGDIVTTTTDSNGCVATGGPVLCVGALFVTDTQVDSLAAFGDSLVAGAQTTNGSSGWPTRLTMLDRYLSCYNSGSSGQTTIDTYRTLKGYLEVNKPKYAVFKAWSPNDGYAQTAFDTACVYCAGMIEACRDKGVTPVVLTSGPVNSYTADQNARRLAQNLKTKNLVKNGVLVLDVASVVTQPGTDNTINPSYTAVDGLHYNDAGHGVIASYIATKLGY